MPIPSTGRWMRRGSSIYVYDLGITPEQAGIDLEPLSSLDHESPERFSYDDVHPIVVALLDAGLIDLALEEAVRHGDTNANHLTDIVFFKIYPSRGGRFIARGEPDYATISRAWFELYDSVVTNALTKGRTVPTRPPCYVAPAASSGINRVWTFYPVPTDATKFNGFLVNVRKRGFTDLVLEINGHKDETFSLARAKESALRTMAPEFCHLGVDLHLMCWLRPDATYLQQAAQTLRPLCQALPIRSLLFDVEEPWTRNTDEAKARALLGRVWPFGQWPCQLGATGITYLPRSVAPVAERCDYVLPQAYSTDASGPEYVAGVTQRLAYEKWRGLGKPIVMGLAGWNLNLKVPPTKDSMAPRNRPLSEPEAMQLAIVAAERAGVKEVAYWSLVHLAKPDASTRDAFVREAARKARAGLPQSSP